MAHGITLQLQAIRHPEPDVFVAIEYGRDPKGRLYRITARGHGQTYTNPDKDRSLSGKARRAARRAAR